MREYQISTPRFTCWLKVENEVVVQCAPYLRKLCLGKPWAPTRDALLRLHGARLYRLF